MNSRTTRRGTRIAHRAGMTISLLEDMHTHSTFSDGLGSIQDNIAFASRSGLNELAFTDHVRRDTEWLPDYVTALRVARRMTDLRIRIGVEAKLLDLDGALDVPERRHGVEWLYAADHRIPWPGGALAPAEMRALIDAGRATESDVVDALITATERCLRRYERVVVAHLFSALRRLRIDESVVPDAALDHLAATAAAQGAEIEIDERWRCPGARTVAHFLAAGVPVRASTDSHRPDTIGEYTFVRQVLDELASIDETTCA